MSARWCAARASLAFPCGRRLDVHGAIFAWGAHSSVPGVLSNSIYGGIGDMSRGKYTEDQLVQQPAIELIRRPRVDHR